jgi:hypothetical protein
VRIGTDINHFKLSSGYRPDDDDDDDDGDDDYDEGSSS